MGSACGGVGYGFSCHVCCLNCDEVDSRMVFVVRLDKIWGTNLLIVHRERARNCKGVEEIRMNDANDGWCRQSWREVNSQDLFRSKRTLHRAESKSASTSHQKEVTGHRLTGGRIFTTAHNKKSSTHRRATALFYQPLLNNNTAPLSLHQPLSLHNHL